MRQQSKTNIVRLVLLIAVFSLVGCTTVPKHQEVARDPWQGYNRSMYKFNDKVDRTVLKPAAKAYRAVTPDLVEQGISNFFSNLDDVGNSLNNLLQGKPVSAGSDLLRFTMNSTLGIAGLFDVATPSGLIKHNEDFGQTLGVWGVPSGPYVVLPLLGPCTARGMVGKVPDYYTYYPWIYLDHVATANSVTALSAINLRARLLALESIVATDKFFDPYATVRDAYLERRQYLVDDRSESSETIGDELMIEELEAMDDSDEPDDTASLDMRDG